MKMSVILLLSFRHGADDLLQGTLDIMVQRTGEGGRGPVVFIQNNFYYDAFFLKAIGTWPTPFYNDLFPSWLSSQF